MPRIAVDRDLVVKDLLTETRSSADLRVHTATFVGVPGVEGEAEISYQIRNSLRLEDHGINSRIDGSRISAFERLADRFTSDPICIELRNVVVTPEKISRACSVRRSRRNRQTHVR